jgi:4-amino-4-deoxy-L-arabinose transferase-like glycosyltransferase
MSTSVSRLAIAQLRNPVWLILILAGFLRLAFPAVTEFKADEARLYALALDMAQFKSFALRGIGSSVGIPNFPMSVWVFSIPLFIWKHPYSATLFVGLLNTLAVYAGYRITRRYWGEAAALTAALLFAVSPWAVIYSRKIWAQDLLPLFVLGYVGTALAAFVDGRRWALLFHFVFLACVIQLHLSGVAFVPLTALMLVIFWKRIRSAWREIVLGMGAAIVLAIPFGIWALQTMQNASNVSGLLARPAEYSFESLRLAWLVWCGFDIHSLAGPNAFRDYLASVPNIDLVRWLWGLGTLAGLWVAVRRRQPADLILILWPLIPILFFIRHSTPVFPHYFIITLPAAYILAGLAAQAIWGKLTARTPGLQGDDQKITGRSLRLRGVLFVFGLISLALTQAGVWLALLAFVVNHNTTGGFGTPLGSLLQTVDVATRLADEKNVPEVLVVGAGDDPAVHEFPAVMDVLLPSRPHRFVNGNEAVVLPQAGSVVILESNQLRAGDWYSSCAQSNGCVVQTLERGLSVVTVPPGAPVRVANPFPDPHTLANGVNLIGWDTNPVWTVIWSPGFVPAAKDYHFFNHALNAQVDGVGYPSRYWRDGDVILSFFDLPPTGPVRVGMYEYPAVTNVPVLDVVGLPWADAVVAQP